MATNTSDEDTYFPLDDDFDMIHELLEDNEELEGDLDEICGDVVS